MSRAIRLTVIWNAILVYHVFGFSSLSVRQQTNHQHFVSSFKAPPSPNFNGVQPNTWFKAVNGESSEILASNTVTMTYDPTRELYEEWCELFGKDKEDIEKYEIFRDNYEQIEECTKQPMAGIVLSQYADYTWDEYVAAMMGTTGENICGLLNDLTVKELKEECRKRKILVGGRKAELVNRLQAALRLMREGGASQEVEKREASEDEEEREAVLKLEEEERSAAQALKILEIEAVTEEMQRSVEALEMEKAEAQTMEQVDTEINGVQLEDEEGEVAHVEEGIVTNEVSKLEQERLEGAEITASDKEAEKRIKEEMVQEQAQRLEELAEEINGILVEPELSANGMAKVQAQRLDNLANEINEVLAGNSGVTKKNVGGATTSDQYDEKSLFEDIVDLGGILFNRMLQEQKSSMKKQDELREQKQQELRKQQEKQDARKALAAREANKLKEQNFAEKERLTRRAIQTEKQKALLAEFEADAIAAARLETKAEAARSRQYSPETKRNIPAIEKGVPQSKTDLQKEMQLARLKREKKAEQERIARRKQQQQRLALQMAEAEQERIARRKQQEHRLALQVAEAEAEAIAVAKAEAKSNIKKMEEELSRRLDAAADVQVAIDKLEKRARNMNEIRDNQEVNDEVKEPAKTAKDKVKPSGISFFSSFFPSNAPARDEKTTSKKQQKVNLVAKRQNSTSTDDIQKALKEEKEVAAMGTRTNASTSGGAGDYQVARGEQQSEVEMVGKEPVDWVPEEEQPGDQWRKKYTIVKGGKKKRSVDANVIVAKSSPKSKEPIVSGIPLSDVFSLFSKKDSLASNEKAPPKKKQKVDLPSGENVTDSASEGGKAEFGASDSLPSEVSHSGKAAEAAVDQEPVKKKKDPLRPKSDVGVSVFSSWFGTKKVIAAPPVVSQMTYRPTSNLEATTKFYEGSLNFTAATQLLEGQEKNTTRIYKVAPEAYIGFYLEDNATSSSIQASTLSGAPMLILFTKDLVGWAKRLQSENVPTEISLSNDKLLFQDPNGYQLEIRRLED